MKLTHLTARRGPVQIDTPIPPVLYLTGANASGKTTVLDLIRLGITGPDRARIPSPWDAALTFTDGIRIDRSVRYDTGDTGDVGDLRHELRVYDGGIEQAHGKIRVGQTLIDSQIGGAWTWNAATLFEATAPERRKAIGKLLGPSLSAGDALVALTKREAARVNAPTSIQDRLADAVNALATVARTQPENGAEVLRVWLDGVRAAKTKAQADAASFAQVLQTNEARLKDAGAPEGSVHHAQEQVDKIRETLTTWRERDAAAAATRAHLASLQQRANVIRTDVETMEAQLRAHEISSAKASELLTAARSETARIKVQLDADTGRANACIEAWHAARQRDRETQAADVLRDDLAVVLSTASESDSRDRLHALLERQPPDAPAAEAAAEAAKRVVSRTAMLLQQSERGEATEQHSIDLFATKIRYLTEQLEARRSELRAVETELGGIEPPPVDEMVQAQIAAATSDLAAAEIRLQGLQTYAVLTADRDRAGARSRQASDARTALHQFEKHVERSVSDLYSEMVGPLVGPASAITEAVLGAPVHLDPTQDWWIGLGQLPIEHLSESTTAIVGVALHAAVVGLARRSRWRAVLLDGGEVIQDDRRLALLRALAETKLHNVVMASVDDGIRPHDAVTIVMGES